MATPLRLRSFLLPLLASFAAVAAYAQAAPSLPPTLLVAADRRPAQSLNGDWHFMTDPYNNGIFSTKDVLRNDGWFLDREPAPGSNRLQEYDFAKTPTIKVPGDWNTQRPELFLYEGGFWYERHVDFQPVAGQRTFLHIGAANYRSHAFLNGHLLCEHEGGFTPFDCDATTALHAGTNSVVIYVDDTRLADGVPTLRTDWQNYGGLTRDVSLISVPTVFIDDFDLHLDRATRSVIEGYVHVEGGSDPTPVEVSIPELHATVHGVTDAQGRLAVQLPVSHLSLWAPGNPKLYDVKLTAGADTLTDRMGFRTIETRGSEILLNGQPIRLEGVSLHAEAPFRTGRADSDADVATLLGWVKELGANYMRLAHYPHDERMERAADQAGILIWSEIPAYWALEYDNPAVFEKSRQQLHDNIRRDRDKASVIFWSIANETPNTAARTAFLTRSAEYVHSQDATRLVTAALLVRREGPADRPAHIIDDPLGKVLDVIGFNEYIGWYEGAPELADAVTWRIAYDKPLIVSEFGAGAKAGLHGPATQRWTEEYQASVYTHNIAMLNKIPQLRGATPWVLMDFRSPARQLPGIQDGFNRKGLVSDQGEKKKAFLLLQQTYRGQGIGHAE